MDTAMKNETLKPQDVTIVIVDDTSDAITERLGITDKRMKELQKVIKIAMIRHDTSFTDALLEVSKECKHVNELAFCSMEMGNIRAMKNLVGGLLMHKFGHDEHEG